MGIVTLSPGRSVGGGTMASAVQIGDHTTCQLLPPLTEMKPLTNRWSTTPQGQ